LLDADEARAETIVQAEHDHVNVLPGAVCHSAAWAADTGQRRVVSAEIQIAVLDLGRPVGEQRELERKVISATVMSCLLKAGEGHAFLFTQEGVLDNRYDTSIRYADVGCE
jgi:hypothetical protein